MVHLHPWHVRKRNETFCFISSLTNSEIQRLKFATLGNVEGNWAKLLIAKTSGTVTKDKDKYWPIAGRRVSEIIAGRISAPNPVLFLKRRARKLSFNSYEDGDA